LLNLFESLLLKHTLELLARYATNLFEPVAHAFIKVTFHTQKTVLQSSLFGLIMQKFFSNLILRHGDPCCDFFWSATEIFRCLNRWSELFLTVLKLISFSLEFFIFAIDDGKLPIKHLSIIFKLLNLDKVLKCSELLKLIAFFHGPGNVTCKLVHELLLIYLAFLLHLKLSVNLSDRLTSGQIRVLPTSLFRVLKKLIKNVIVSVAIVLLFLLLRLNLPKLLSIHLLMSLTKNLIEWEWRCFGK